MIPLESDALNTLTTTAAQQGSPLALLVGVVVLVVGGYLAYKFLLNDNSKLHSKIDELHDKVDGVWDKVKDKVQDVTDSTK